MHACKEARTPRHVHTQSHLSPPSEHARPLSTYITGTAGLDLWLIVLRYFDNKHCRAKGIHLTVNVFFNVLLLHFELALT